MKITYKKKFSDKNLQKFIKKNKMWTRRSIITPKLCNKTLEIHNGKQFIAIKITKNMIGHKLGEFSFTRKIYQYKKGKKHI